MVSRTSKSVPVADEISSRKLMRRSQLIVDCLRRRPTFVLLLLPVAFLASFYVVSSEKDYDLEPRYPSFVKSYNAVDGTMEGYLVWNSRCQMPSKKPVDPSIRSYVKKKAFEKCANEPPFTGLSVRENGTVVLFVNPATAARHPGLRCCWSPVYRAEKQPKKPTKDNNVDTSIVVKRCENFEKETTTPDDAQAVMVSCTVDSKIDGGGGQRGKPIYENVHAIPNPEKVRDRTRRNDSQQSTTFGTVALSRKLSVLVLGIDSVSRLNFIRSMPITERYLLETGWIRFDGYNKMGDNTFPNLMAILTGQNQSQAYSLCKPTVPYMLDRCPFLWRNFRDAGYATAYGEDETALNTFNYLKMGFVEPPTDYYLRPYMLACEKLLKVKKRFGLKYCTGPETSFDRILDYAIEYARAFRGTPYFGFFWTISVSHENANGLSSMDGRLLDKLKRLESEGIANDTMIVLLSDHGMRWGPIRNTFIGWYEERLPFLYLWLPEWFREERPEAYSSLRANQRRLISPFDLYETLRDVLQLSGGSANPSSGCPGCRSLLAGPVPLERGCSDVGISSHWCACSAFESVDPRDPIVQKGAQVFLDHVDKLLDGYRDKKGRRLCAKLRLKKLHRVDRVIDFGSSSSVAYFYMIQVSPGDGKFEVTVRYHENGTYTLSDHEVSRINQYASTAGCLDRGTKQYCHCLK
ncbi:uncharacterized protein LOC117166779 isoform X2 [Bombus vancouverensis nearcticus]|uniref:Uncharacterized protein LOC117214024 n=1 Tax=Bombus bifarius TaxID=103933 RepID=A0A6P8N5H6_9HYME|nr:uncharacterized protein LOC117214024 [Bombus bifarius]